MAKKTTLKDLAQLIEKGFAAVAGDIGEMKTDLVDIKRNMATKEQVVALHTQVNSIEAQLRQTKAERRLADLEESLRRIARVKIELDDVRVQSRPDRSRSPAALQTRHRPREAQLAFPPTPRSATPYGVVAQHPHPSTERSERATKPHPAHPGYEIRDALSIQSACTHTPISAHSISKIPDYCLRAACITASSVTTFGRSSSSTS